MHFKIPEHPVYESFYKHHRYFKKNQAEAIISRPQRFHRKKQKQIQSWICQQIAEQTVIDEIPLFIE